MATVLQEKLDPKRWLSLIAVSLGVFMALIDTTVVNVALPSIQTSLNASYSDLQWVISAYTIVFSVLLLIWAKLGDLYGRKLMFIVGLIIFTIGSGLDAVSTSISMLHIFRAVQAIGGSALMSLSFALIGTTFNGKERGMALGILSSIIGLSTASGPLVGGWLVDAFSWQSIFTINLPIGIITIIMTSLFISNQQAHHATGSVDYLGMLLSTGTIFSLVFGLVQKEMNASWGWDKLQVAGYLIMAVILFILFIWRQRTAKNPMMDLGMFKSSSFTGAVLVAFFLGAGLYGFFAYLSTFMQNYVGYSAWDTGLRQATISGFSLILGPIAGMLTNRLRHGYMLATSALFIGVGLFTLSALTTTTATFADFWPAFIIIGIGNGSINPPMTTAAMSSVAPRQMGMASGMISTFMQVGVSFGVVFQGLHLADGYQAGLAKHLPEVTGSSATTIATLHKVLVDAGPFSGHMIVMSKQLIKAPFAHELQIAVRKAFDQGFISIIRLDAMLLIIGGIVAAILIKTGGQGDSN
ncbi:MFS transporter [Leuconostoc gelidum subsp. gelidum]|uniref:MFS transporter n=1 Tax=Leuconostoc gelidum subsp. gelidum TaxID=1607839 RepID=A0AB35G002_LEUGE|nr:MFS transporter [Leuconostoc gelidum]MBZ5963546.1 MFS transporter [Leuconostoc gelidum subsp. gelidum]MBZ5975612.1 MFS transporter [Leuconostoc gelidum subsp. gelidum]MBZ5976220.1 MFS transporter [Leuconostoc gelidum subsp. gelidum]MBZ5987003.1 MFS transporter [Leuconostoc gelidum subsp. gelidum]MBZ6000121.1 MFS transporter [Leuconostoc gelidum subsp. gelidum]